jgi:hypothetical protein
MRVSRPWHQQGKKAEARQLLAEVYGWFTEGFETKDLQEAKALLAELAGVSRKWPTAFPLPFSISSATLRVSLSVSSFSGFFPLFSLRIH